MEPAVRVEELSKRFIINQNQASLQHTLVKNLRSLGRRGGTQQDFWALDDVNFEVAEGEVFGIVGRNGAGKSTLLKILSQITPPTRGRVEMNGRTSSLLEVGTGFHPELTGRENIYLNGTVLGMTRREVKEKFDEIVDFSGVSKFLDTPIKRYSSGMKVRLAFSVAAHLEPEILIVDEVLAVGDADFQKKCIQKMSDLSSERGRTVLFVSHNQGAVRRLCTQAMVLNKGKLTFLGDVSEAISQYQELALGATSLDDLSAIEDRNGNQWVKVTGFSCLDMDSGQTTMRPIPGHSYQIHFQLQKHIPDTVDINLGVGFRNREGSLMTTLNSRMTGANISMAEDTLTVSCQLEKFPLLSGPYYLLITLRANQALSDQITLPSMMMVEKGDYYDSSEANDWGQQGVYVPHHWAIL
ncbi:MAG TPA: hypothetical protein DCE41_23730 [Cytophagales bacterium]|nr:hypothetical protein [Cytophagales bacterium]HAA18633.1 hypothetical protein [Cytophagales bacterium]HAP64573.1 hypothetical protein [Cytophagales bacterium]